jgi:thiamine biosynthesis lipoprotein
VRRLLAGFALASLVVAHGCGGRGPDVHVRDGAAMGTIVEVKVVTEDSVAAERALDAVFAELTRVEQFASSHLATSELSRLNARASSDIETTAEMDSLLRAALRASEVSGGAFDATIGPLVTLWGFPEHPALPDSAAIAAARRHVGWQGLVPAGRDAPAGGSTTWTFADPGMRLDLGGIACGWAVDRAADAAMASVRACLVNVGGDITVRGTRPDGTAWVIGIQHPRDPTKLVRRIRVPPGAAVATSGDYEHFFDVAGVRYHHLLDPRTGFPATGAVSATVIATTSLAADTWSTAAFVLGPKEGLQRLEEDPDLEGILISLTPEGDLVFHETSGMGALFVE